MNGIEKITARIDAQTQEEIDRLLADAKEQAEQITAQYRAQAEGRYYTVQRPDSVSVRSYAGKLRKYLEGISNCDLYQKQHCCSWRIYGDRRCVCSPLRIRTFPLSV